MCGDSVMDTLQLREHFNEIFYPHHIRLQYIGGQTNHRHLKFTQRFCCRWSKTAYVSAFKVLTRRRLWSVLQSSWLTGSSAHCAEFRCVPLPSPAMKGRPLVTQNPVSCYPDALGQIMTKLSVQSSSVSFFETGLTNNFAALTSWTTRFKAPKPSLMKMPLCSLFSTCVPVQH